MFRMDGNFKERNGKIKSRVLLRFSNQGRALKQISLLFVHCFFAGLAQKERTKSEQTVCKVRSERDRQ